MEYHLLSICTPHLCQDQEGLPHSAESAIVQELSHFVRWEVLVQWEGLGTWEWNGYYCHHIIVLLHYVVSYCTVGTSHAV